MKIGTHLFTRDGRQIGNAIVTGLSGDAFEIETDFGNSCILNQAEVDAWFYTTGKDGEPRIVDVAEWRADRETLRIVLPDEEAPPEKLGQIEAMTDAIYEVMMRELTEIVRRKASEGDAFTVNDFFEWVAPKFQPKEVYVNTPEAAAPLLIALSGVFQEYLERSHGISFSPN